MDLPLALHIYSHIPLKQVAVVQVTIRDSSVNTQFCIRPDFTVYFSLSLESLLRGTGCVILCRGFLHWRPDQPFGMTWSYTHASFMDEPMAREQ